MSIFHPTIRLRKISQITPRLLKRLGVAALILDVDNTLATHNNPMPDKNVLHWLDTMHERNIPLVIASNNTNRRVAPFARQLSLHYTANSMKPLPVGFIRTAKQFGLPASKIGIVGDQIFTDILGGNLFGAKTILVEPLELETGWTFRLKRKLEAIILKHK